MTEYILNLTSRKLHKSFDGMTLESCNVDQIKSYAVLTELPEDGNYYRCFRCNAVPAGESTGGVAQ